jgi:SUKH superfamily protein
MKPETWARLDRLFADNLAIAGRAITVARGVPSDEEIAGAAESLGREFDPNYIAFLKRYGGAVVGSLPVFGLRPVEVIGKVWSVVEVTRRYRDQNWPGTADWYVISEDGFGNPIGIDADGKVMISDHDHGDIAILARNFEDFLLLQCDMISPQ